MKLFNTYKLGHLSLKNRVVMAPLTRSRSIGNTPSELVATYYSQRAGAGLIISEGTSPSPNGLGYARIPGLYNREQMVGWAKVANAVHQNSGRIFVQLMHTGRMTNVVNLPPGARVLAPSAIAPKGEIYTDAKGNQPYSLPQEMTEADIKEAVSEYVTAAALAIEAGIDGVELHAANGYLLEQFLNPLANQRTDKYGGSPENRMRFVLEVAAAVAAKIGGDRVGIRVSPYGLSGSMGAFDGIEEFYTTLSQKLSNLGLVYIHVVDHSAMGGGNITASIKQKIRDNFKGTFILSGGYTTDRAEADLIEGKGDLVAFGRPFISNPDLVRKLQAGEELRTPNHATFYTPGPEGYTDY